MTVCQTKLCDNMHEVKGVFINCLIGCCDLQHSKCVLLIG